VVPIPSDLESELDSEFCIPPKKLHQIKAGWRTLALAMGSGDAQGDSLGDAGVSMLGAAKSIGTPSSPRSPLPESRAMGGSRFWALADESSDEEDLPEVGSGAVETLRSPRSGLSVVMLGDFLSPTWLQVRPG
jgi:hypothetical protein